MSGAMSQEQKQIDQGYRDSTVFWFVRLEKAREHQNHEQAAEAIRELRRLGVNVRFAPLEGAHELAFPATTR